MGPDDMLTGEFDAMDALNDPRANSPQGLIEVLAELMPGVPEDVIASVAVGIVSTLCAPVPGREDVYRAGLEYLKSRAGNVELIEADAATWMAPGSILVH